MKKIAQKVLYVTALAVSIIPAVAADPSAMLRDADQKAGDARTRSRLCESGETAGSRSALEKDYEAVSQLYRSVVRSYGRNSELALQFRIDRVAVAAAATDCHVALGSAVAQQNPLTSSLVSKHIQGPAITDESKEEIATSRNLAGPANH